MRFARAYICDRRVRSQFNTRYELIGLLDWTHPYAAAPFYHHVSRMDTNMAKVCFQLECTVAFDAPCDVSWYPVGHRELPMLPGPYIDVRCSRNTVIVCHRRMLLDLPSAELQIGGKR